MARLSGRECFMGCSALLQVRIRLMGNRFVKRTQEQIEADFWDRTNKELAGPSSCWNWSGYKKDFGHGQVKINGKAVATHRFAYELTHGPITPEQVVRHVVCDNPACCNPAHLDIGTHADNVADRVAKGRSATGDRNGNSLARRAERFTRMSGGQAPAVATA